ncbi:hypothetical protein GCM10017771_75260 [Streptomyces capitiformicae]|uniref:Uncharacterized protein n=1 Tax=Streptomyces capitiformicae TaxID=2014920 RepID=A0A919DL01_9ACTN|nr:hypothetical protein GCM10017771_75260 [Streptomyces capitiformicae]
MTQGRATTSDGGSGDRPGGKGQHSEPTTDRQHAPAKLTTTHPSRRTPGTFAHNETSLRATCDPDQALRPPRGAGNCATSHNEPAPANEPITPPHWATRNEI